MKRILFGVLLATVVLFSLSACGGSTKSTAQATPTKATAGTASTQSPTKAAATVAPATGSTAADKLVTTADVEKVTGLTGIKTVPRDPSKGAGGDLNFATQDDNLVLMVLVSGSSLYKPSKDAKGAFHAEVSGIGDEAFDGPADENNFYAKPGEKADPFFLVFRKGSSVVTLSSFMGLNQKAYLSQDKLRELAKVAVSRL